MIENLQDVWNIIAPYVAGGTLGGTMLTVFVLIIKSIVLKVEDRIKAANDNKAVADDIYERLVEKFKTVSFEQNIQPVVKSELKKVTEEANEYIKQELKETQEGYNKLLACLEKLAAYFDNSIGVPEEAKTALKEAIEQAKTPEEPVSVVTSAPVEEKTEVVVETKKASKKKVAEIER